MKTHRIASIDIGRLVACMMITFIHISPFLSFGETLNFYVSYGICRIAVPFFFITSSYLFFKNGANIKKYALRMLKYYLFWFVVSFPIIIYNSFVVANGGFLSKCFMFLHKAAFASTFQGSWFIIACIAGAVYWNIKFKGSDILLTLIALFFFVMDCLSSSYHSLTNNNDFFSCYSSFFIAPSNNVFCCLIFFGIGKYFANNEERPKTVHKALSLFVISIVALLIEISVVLKMGLYRSTDGYFSLLFVAPLAFLLCIEHKDYIPKKMDTVLISKFSSITYPLHLIMLFYINAISRIFSFGIEHLFKYILILSICLLTTLLVTKFEKNNKILKYSY